MKLEDTPLHRLVRRVRRPAFPTLVCAHRGDSHNAPENTMAAFELAIAAGADMIECDVRATADDAVIVFHDPKLDRTTDAEGEVLGWTLAQLRGVDAGGWFDSRYTREPIPTLSELLDLCRGQVLPMIEIKDKLVRAPKLGPLVAEVLRDAGMLGEAIVIVRDLARALEFEAIAPELTVSMVSFTGYQARGFLKGQNVHGIDHYWQTLSARLVSEVREAGKFITPWTVNRRRDMERCLALGIECLLTDSPALLRDVLEERQLDEVVTAWRRETPGSRAEPDLEDSSAELGVLAESEIERLES